VYVASEPFASLGQSLSDLTTLRIELDSYVRWLLRREPIPSVKGSRPGIGDYHEMATAVYGRAKEIEMLLHRQEADGHIPKGSAMYRFRTGELRSFLDLASKCFERGSREITEAQLAMEAMRAGI
jgi:hypothetical protein